MRSLLPRTALALLPFSTPLGCTPRNFNSAPSKGSAAIIASPNDSSVHRYEVRDPELKQKLENLVTYLEKNSENLDLFMDYANGAAGTPLILFRVFPYLFPEIWGRPGSQRDSFDFSEIGIVNPRNPDSPFPFGFGWSREDPIGDYPRLSVHSPQNEPPLEGYRPVNVTCGGCHAQFVRSAAGSAPKLIVGGANQQKNVFQFFAKLGQTAQHPNFTASKILAVMKEKYEAHGPEWFFSRGIGAPRGDAAALRAVVERDYKKLAAEGEAGIRRIGGQLLEKGTLVGLLALSTFGSENGAGMPGQAAKAPISQLNGSFSAYGLARLLGHVNALRGGLLAEFATANPGLTPGTPEHSAGFGAFVQREIPRRMMTYPPARTDIPSVWGQGIRSSAQWDGTIKEPMLRNLAAAIATVFDFRVLDTHLSDASAALLKELPPPPYPFAVDRTRAKRGESLFGSHCAGCHSKAAYEPGARSNAMIYPAVARKDGGGVPASGSESYRAYLYNEEFSANLNRTLLRGCPPEKAECKSIDRGSPVVANALPLAQRGYLATPLDGIWATAPYMHNGSVPTIYHLLVPKSRAEAEVFVRGRADYDEVKMGFQWQGEADGSSVQRYDTKLHGQSNAGHDTLDYLGLDWSSDPEKTKDLIEFMKTL